MERNEYLAGHPRAAVSVAMKKVSDKIKQLKVDGWLTVTGTIDRSLSLYLAEDALQEKTRLDGCYVIKTDLPKEAADRETVHNRYKDLAIGGAWLPHLQDGFPGGTAGLCEK